MLWMLPLALMAQSATGSDDDPWMQFGYTDTFTAYINPSTARVLPDGSRAVWLEYRLKKPDKDGTVRMLSRQVFNCENETSSTTAMTWYGASGNVTYSHTNAPYERTVEAITPDSIIDSAFKLVCKK